MDNNKVHREVGLQSNLKMVISLIASQFSGEGDIKRALSVINNVAVADTNVGFLRYLSGTGTILGNVMIIDLNVPLMSGYPKNKRDEAVFNRTVAKALVSEFGRLNVGYVTSEPVVTRRVVVETHLTNTELASVLGDNAKIV